MDDAEHPALRPSGAAPLSRRVQAGSCPLVEPSLESVVQIHPAARESRLRQSTFDFPELVAGGGRWIRTTEGVSQQIYSLPPLAAWVSLQISLNSALNFAIPKPGGG